MPFENGFHAIWLDGRNTKLTDAQGNEVYGQMTLRGAQIDFDGQMSNEFEIDSRVCDCCQTDLIDSEYGLLAVYRNRTQEEIRDIYFSIFKNGTWSVPQPVHTDNWKISGCPVNGPAAAAHNDKIAVAWYTEGKGTPEVYLSLYNAEKNRFGTPVLISNEYVLGRLDLVFTYKGDLALAYMIRKPDNSAEIILEIIDPVTLKTKQKIPAGTTTSSRSSGFPRMASSGDQTLLLYTQVENDKTRLKAISVK